MPSAVPRAAEAFRTVWNWRCATSVPRHPSRLLVLANYPHPRSRLRASQPVGALRHTGGRCSIHPRRPARRSAHRPLSQRGPLPCGGDNARDDQTHPRGEMDIRPTPRDKGLTLTIRVTAYDNGMIAVDGVPINQASTYDPGTAGSAPQRQPCSHLASSAGKLRRGGRRNRHHLTRRSVAQACKESSR